MDKLTHEARMQEEKFGFLYAIIQLTGMNAIILVAIAITKEYSALTTLLTWGGFTINALFLALAFYQERKGKKKLSTVEQKTLV